MAPNSLRDAGYLSADELLSRKANIERRLDDLVSTLQHNRHPSDAVKSSMKSVLDNLSRDISTLKDQAATSRGQLMMSEHHSTEGADDMEDLDAERDLIERASGDIPNLLRRVEILKGDRRFQ